MVKKPLWHKKLYASAQRLLRRQQQNHTTASANICSTTDEILYRLYVFHCVYVWFWIECDFVLQRAGCLLATHGICSIYNFIATDVTFFNRITDEEERGRTRERKKSVLNKNWKYRLQTGKIASIRSEYLPWFCGWYEILPLQREDQR